MNQSSHIQRMVNFLQETEQLLLILGEHGTGKSSLLKHFGELGRLPANTIELKGKANLQPFKLTKAICKQWHLKIKAGQAFSQQQLDDILVAMKKYHQAGLIIIDAAHLLPIATLAALMHICLNQQAHQIVLRIILVGEPSLENTLSNLHHPNIIIPKIELGPLTKTETLAFVEHTLDKMGVGKQHHLDDAQVDQIFQQSRGIPANINKALTPYLRNKSHSTSEITQQLQANTYTEDKGNWLQRHWIKVASLAMLSFAFIGMHQYQKRMNAMNNLVLSKPTPTLPKHHSALPALAHYTPLSHTSQPTEAKKAALSLPSQPIAVKKLVQAATTPIAPAVPSIAKPAAILAATTAPVIKTKQPLIETTPIVKAPHPLLATIKTKVVAAAPIAAIKTKPATKITTPAAITKPTPALAATKHTTPHYVIQLMGNYTKASLQRAQTKLAAQTTIRKQQRNGKDWFILTYGAYDTSKQAHHALKQLPAELKANHPWIKPLH